MADEIGIKAPPDEIFQNAARRTDPKKSILENQGASYIPDHAEYKENEGTFVYYRTYIKEAGDLGERDDIPFPQRNVSPEDAVYATNTPKRNLMTLLWFLISKEARPFLFVFIFSSRTWKGELISKICEQFISAADPVMSPFYMKKEFYSPVVIEIQKAIASLLISFLVPDATAEKMGEIIGCMFEWDWAYRWPLQDICGETTKEALLENLPKELERLIIILKSRDNTVTVTGKFETGLKVLKLLWKIPRYKRILRKSIQSLDLKKMEMDEGEIYHTILYSPYNTKGRNLEERLKLYERYHGADQSKWPPRIIFTKS